MDLFINGFFLSFNNKFQVLLSMPCTNLLGSNEGLETIELSDEEPEDGVDTGH